MERVCETFLDRLQRAPEPGRIVNVTSASGPMYMCKMGDGDLKNMLLSKDVKFADVKSRFIEPVLKVCNGGTLTDFHELGNGGAYGLSKAAANSYTRDLARNFVYKFKNLKC